MLYQVIKRFFFFLLLVSVVHAKGQTSCAEVRDRSQAALNAITFYEGISSPMQKDFEQLMGGYTRFRDYAISTAATETDYDIKLLLQVYAVQNATHFLIAAARRNEFDLAWKEMKYCYDNVYSMMNYQKRQDRKDNWVACSLLAESKKLEINESIYHDICTEFICYSCNIIFHYKKDAVTSTIFAKAGFKGHLSHGSLLHSTAGDILNKRLDKGQLDDTCYLAAYKFLLTDREPQSMAGISSDFANMTVAKALDILVNPSFVERSNTSPLKDMDEFEKTSMRYDNLYSYLAQDSGFRFPQKFELLRIALSDYLAEMRSIKITNHSFWQLPALYRLLDEAHEGYVAKKELQDILASGNTELLTLLAQVYELYGQYCYAYYPDVEKAHDYYYAYLCYRAAGDEKKATRAFKEVPHSMLASKKSLGYQKLD